MNHVILSGIGYNVTVLDNQVIFEESHPMWGCFRTFALERPTEINNSPGIWYLTHMESTWGKTPASHISEALRYCQETFGKSFEPYKGDLKGKDV